MAYRLEQEEPVEAGLQRIARQQLKRAIAELTDPDMATAEAVHQVRKRFKKLRGLLRLVRPALGKKAYKRHNRRFRDLGRALAGARDAEVMQQTLADLREDLPARELRLDGLQRELDARQQRVTSGQGQELEERTVAVGNALLDARRQVDDWSLAANGYAAVGPGLMQSYRKGRKALAMARRKPADENFHEWRKRVKDHWYHSRLLRDTWPAVMKAYAQEMKRLSDLLGDDHDLAVFRRTVEKLPAQVLPVASRDPLCRCIAQRQARLRKEAVRLGRIVYADKPKRYCKRIGGRWAAWRGSG